MLNHNSDSNKIKTSIIKDNKLIYFIRRVIQSEILPFLVLFIAMIILHRFISMTPGDDTWFAQASANYSFPDYIKLRYAGWTGRISSETVLYYIFKDNAMFWKIINPIFIILFAYSMSRMVTEKKLLEKNKRRSINWFICLGLLYLSKEVLWESIFWITGSIVYLWGGAAGMFAMLPFKDAVVREYKNAPQNIFYLIFAIYAALDQEQIALVIIVFSIIINVQLYVKYKKIYKFLILETFVMIICFLISYFAPGNFVRIHSEINSWLPNYPFYGKLELGFIGMQWLLDGLVNHSRLILLMLITTLGGAVFSKYKGIRYGYFTLIPFIGSSLLVLAVIFKIPDYITNKIHFLQTYNNLFIGLQNLLFNFNGDYKLFSILTIKFIIWSIIFFLIPFYLIMLYNFTIKGFYSILIYLAGICSAAIMIFSPTIYASGYRTVFVMNILLFLLFILIIKNINELLKNRYILLFSIFPIFKYILFFQFFIP